MLYCTNCRSELNDMLLFCPNCGKADSLTSLQSDYREKHKEKLHSAMVEHIRHLPEFSLAQFGGIENFERNAHGQVYGEISVYYLDRFGEQRTARFCAVADRISSKECVFSSAGPQRMADFAKPYLAKRNLGFKD